jgi:hypothetical protein
MERGTIVTYVVTAPNEDVILGITVMPPESTLTSQQVIEAARKKVSQAMPGGVSDVERSVGGRRLKGLLVVQGDDRMMIFCVDHLSRVYVVVLDIKNAASQAERDAADYMLDRLRFLDGQ